MTDFAEHVRNMKALGEMLVRYSFPLGSEEDEQAVACLKRRRLAVDGHEVVVYYSKSSHADTKIEVAQVYGAETCYLPMDIVSKVGRAFLGDDHLCLTTAMTYQTPNLIDDHARKIYSWTRAADRFGRPIQNSYVPAAWRGWGYRVGSPTAKVT